MLCEQSRQVIILEQKILNVAPKRPPFTQLGLKLRQMLYNTALVASQTEWLVIYTASRNATRVLEQLLAYKSQLLHEPTGATAQRQHIVGLQATPTLSTVSNEWPYFFLETGSSAWTPTQPHQSNIYGPVICLWWNWGLHSWLAGSAMCKRQRS